MSWNRQQWTLMKGKRETPCCRQQVRVKVVEVGYQYRRCPLCRQLNVFVLEEMARRPGTLRFRWLTDSEIEQLDGDGSDLAEVELKDL